jgi:hypothetical protein
MADLLFQEPYQGFHHFDVAAFKLSSRRLTVVLLIKNRFHQDVRFRGVNYYHVAMSIKTSFYKVTGPKAGHQKPGRMAALLGSRNECICNERNAGPEKTNRPRRTLKKNKTSSVPSGFWRRASCRGRVSNPLEPPTGPGRSPRRYCREPYPYEKTGLKEDL